MQLFGTKCYVFWKKFSTLAALTAFSNTTSTTIPCAALRQREEFCDFFYNFYKKFWLFSWCSFQKIRNWKCIVIKKPTSAKCIWKKLIITSTYHNTIAHNNLILEIGYTYNANSVFLPRSTFYKFFSEGIFFRASWNFLGQVDIRYHLPDGQVAKKVKFNPCVVPKSC